MISLQNVSKYFGSKKVLDDITLAIQPGEIVGFLGQNGAGKTTLMRILTTFLAPSSGKVTVAGFDLSIHSLEARRRIGYLPENPPLYKHMTVRNYLLFAAQLKDVPSNQLRIQLAKVAHECQLGEVLDQRIGILSKGFQQRVGIAQAIIHEPQVLILDEPTNGLDPLQILQVRNLIKSFEGKRTVILSTHILSEIELMAKRVIILQSGRILLDDAMENVLEKSPNTSLEQTFLSLAGKEAA